MHYWKGILFLRYIFQSVMYRLCIYPQLWISYFCFESVWIRHVIFSLGKYYHKSYCCVFIKGKVSESYTCEISINIQVRGNGVALCWLWKFLSYAYFVTWKQTFVFNLSTNTCAKNYDQANVYSNSTKSTKKYNMLYSLSFEQKFIFQHWESSWDFQLNMKRKSCVV